LFLYLYFSYYTDIYTLSLHDALPISGDRPTTEASRSAARSPTIACARHPPTRRIRPAVRLRRGAHLRHRPGGHAVPRAPRRGRRADAPRRAGRDDHRPARARPPRAWAGRRGGYFFPWLATASIAALAASGSRYSPGPFGRKFSSSS